MTNGERGETVLHEILAAFSAVASNVELAKLREYDPKIGALYTHFVTADAVEYHLRNALKASGGPAPNSIKVSDIARDLSAFRVISVYYALIYVVVEGYHELGLVDEKVDHFLQDAEKVDSLRRFRNATFHFQKDPLSDKLMAHLSEDRYGDWTRDLARALESFFVRKLGLRELNLPD
ncbi:MAG: hypothetical protein H5U24_01595 [Thioclava marina]|uniref:hypothetical protein n=1 Tax=Thioclava marina TaxID=1915077 RepID=UPI001990CE5A|nr:hypothetical protein [Thioclava marina]MBC7144080.1 hypothetical protein [Thioclava marina]